MSEIPPVNTSLTKNIVGAIRGVIGNGSASLHEPTFQGNEWLYLKECLDSTYVSSTGKFVDRFESDLCAYTGAKFAVAVVNGTSALHIALKLSGVIAGDEVLIPSLTFVATANAVAYLGAIPHFVDSEERTLGIDSEKLRNYLLTHTEKSSGLCVNKQSGKVIRALVPMHTFGHPSDVETLLAIAEEFNLVMVEDAAESLGSFFGGRHTGTFGRLGVVSFNGNKTITTGGGGAILTDDPKLARRAKHLTTTAKVPHAWEFNHDELGFNFRMPNLNAALGCAQLEQLDAKIAAKRELFSRYKKAFLNVKGVQLFNEPPNSRSNYWLQTLLLTEEHSLLRDEILQITNNLGIMTRPSWTLMNQLTHYKDAPKMDLTSAISLSRRIINIPSSPKLIRGDI
jgi:perosamine synthetase